MNNKKIAITVNDVLRVFTDNIFPQYQKLLKNRLVNETTSELINGDWVEKTDAFNYIPENDFMGLCQKLPFLKFKDKLEYEKFIFEDFKMAVKVTVAR